ncbi:sigma-70 family RNA polymerase sigma factor [Actinosynnema sp. NPDC023587]|uniref:sigma-70 family RNA polymerase sigma factor n=1 Tax=Actinosynnema sp. NPDC023587 TaxID=3154695 RepID=UPI0033C204B4
MGDPHLPAPGSRAAEESLSAGEPPEPEPPRPEALDDEVRRAVGGDRLAIASLLATIRPLVVRYCRARVGRQERSYTSADDVAQEVCLAVLTALPSYKDHGRPFLAFVYGIAAHKVADAHRSALRNRAEPVSEVPDAPSDEDGPEQSALRAELSRHVAALLKVLPDKQQEILLLRVVVGMTAEQTAAVVGSSPGAVRVAQHRALSRLRKEVGTPRRVLSG